jgi:hypothetical protein
MGAVRSVRSVCGVRVGCCVAGVFSVFGVRATRRRWSVRRCRVCIRMFDGCLHYVTGVVAVVFWLRWRLVEDGNCVLVFVMFVVGHRWLSVPFVVVVSFVIRMQRLVLVLHPIDRRAEGDWGRGDPMGQMGLTRSLVGAAVAALVDDCEQG